MDFKFGEFGFFIVLGCFLVFFSFFRILFFGLYCFKIVSFLKEVWDSDGVRNLLGSKLGFFFCGV